MLIGLFFMLSGFFIYWFMKMVAKGKFGVEEEQKSIAQKYLDDNGAHLVATSIISLIWWPVPVIINLIRKVWNANLD